MITRIVKMEFDPGKTQDFQELFYQNRHRITNFEGCESVILFRDINRENIFFTYSLWDNEDALNLYRKSETFKEIWAKTKPMFREKAEAWSVNQV